MIVDILKHLPPHNAMSEKNYVLTIGVVKLTGRSHGFEGKLLTPILYYAKHNAGSKHMEPHMDLFLQAGVLSAHYCSAIISLFRAVFFMSSYFCCTLLLCTIRLQMYYSQDSLKLHWHCYNQLQIPRIFEKEGAYNHNQICLVEFFSSRS